MSGFEIMTGLVVGADVPAAGHFVTFTGPESGPSEAGGANVQDSGVSLDTDATLAANSDARIASQKAIKAYVAAHGGSVPVTDGTTTVTAPTGLEFAGAVVSNDGGQAKITVQPFLTNPVAKTTTYTALVGDLVEATVTGGGFTVTLPTAPAIGALVGIKKMDSSGNTVTVAPAGGGNDRRQLDRDDRHAVRRASLSCVIAVLPASTWIPADGYQLPILPAAING